MAYIERESLIEFLRNTRLHLPKESKDFFTRDEMLLNFEQYVNAIEPTADVVEVRHSYWQCSNVRMSSRDITCRYCHRTETISNGSEDFEYCPHCGAKMDGKDGE